MKIFEKNNIYIYKLFNIILGALLAFLFYLNQNLLKYNTDQGIKYGLLLVSLIFILIVLVNKASLITLVSLCLNLLLVPLSIQYYTGSSYGILSLNQVPLLMDKVITYLFIYDTCLYLLSLVFNFQKYEKKLMAQPFLQDNNLSIQFRNLVALAFAFVAFPRGFGEAVNGERFNMLLPGKAWNQLAIVALIFNLPYLKKHRSVQLTYLLTIFWFLSHGERADVAGLLAGIVFYWLMQQTKGSLSKHFMKNLLVISTGFIFVALLGYVGYVRIYHVSPNLVTLLKSLATTATITDVGYLYNAAINYSVSFGTIHGQIFKANILSAIPFFDQSTGFTSYINTVYPNPGGEPLLAEPLMDFGTRGLFLISIYDYICFSIPLLFKKRFFKYEFLVLLCSVPRIVWYGRSYVYTSLFFFVPFLYLVSVFLNRTQLTKKLSK